MNNIQSHSLAATPPRQDALSDSQFSSYVRKQSLSAYESLDAGLTIKTKEGDLVTLTSNSYAQMDSFMYDSKGVLKTEAGTIAVTQNIREITLSTGENFAFSVSGDLNEEELADIEAIVKGIDGIISEVAQGDMDDAVAKALSMGGYDTVSMYSADITYQKSYAMNTEVQAQTAAVIPEVASERSSEGHRARRGKHNFVRNINQLFEKMAEKLEKHEGKLIEKAQKPVDNLFKRYLNKMKDDEDNKTPQYNAMDAIRQKMSEMIDEMTNGMFKEKLSAFME